MDNPWINVPTGYVDFSLNTTRLFSAEKKHQNQGVAHRITLDDEPMVIRQGLHRIQGHSPKQADPEFCPSP